jgi:glucose-6-phosphate dehydrogenase assembly protein OpcA
VSDESVIEQLAVGQAEDLWVEHDTTPERIDSALRRLLHDRHAQNQALAPARVLNLVVLVDSDWKGEVANRLARVGRYHASRTVLCAVVPGRTTLDAWAAMSYDASGRAGTVMHEQVEIDLGEEHLARLDTIIDPVIVSALPTVLWCPHGHWEAIDTLRRIVDVMLLDSDDQSEPEEGFDRAAELRRSAYVVDLAWLRTTPWRERLAASFDPARRLPELSRMHSVTVRHQESSTASALLLAGWLASRLRWETRPLAPLNGSGLRGTAARADTEVEIELQSFEQEAPGLAGVTVATDGERYSLSLDRARGGLCARETEDGEERVWQVMGASRGEGGILGEGVRQALLRDPTYGPALDVARRFIG